MKIFNWFKKRPPLIGQAITWKDSIRQVYKVLDFDKFGTVITATGQVKAKSMISPYGYLLVESPTLQSRMRLPIIHQDDFLLASSVFDENGFDEMLNSHELLVAYVPKDYHPDGLAGVDHALHYVIVSLGTIDKYYKKLESNPNIDIEKIFGHLSWIGEIKVQVNLNPDF